MIRDDFSQFLGAGGRLVKVGRAKFGDKETGKRPVATSWQNAEGETIENCIEWLKHGGNVGVIIKGSRLGVIDCDVDYGCDLYRKYNALEDVSSCTLVIRRGNSDYRYKAFFEITDWDDQDKDTLRCVHAPSYDVFIPNETRQCVVAGTHYTGNSLISNGKEIAKVSFADFRRLAQLITGWDVITPQPISEYVSPYKIPSRYDYMKKSELTHPTCEEMLFPLLSHTKRIGDWVNGSITGSNGVNAGYNPVTDKFKVFSTKAGNLSGESGGWWRLFALLHDIDPDDKKRMGEALREAGYGKKIEVTKA